MLTNSDGLKFLLTILALLRVFVADAQIYCYDEILLKFELLLPNYREHNHHANFKPLFTPENGIAPIVITLKLAASYEIILNGTVISEAQLPTSIPIYNYIYSTNIVGLSSIENVHVAQEILQLMNTLKSHEGLTENDEICSKFQIIAYNLVTTENKVTLVNILSFNKSL